MIIIQTKMLIFTSKANLDEKTLFGKITHHLDQEIRKKAYLESRIPNSILIHDVLAFEIKALSLKLTRALNLNFKVT